MIEYRRANQAGFSLIEALVAMALMGLVLTGLASVTAQWLPNWGHGFASVQRNAVLARGVERLVADLTAAEYVPLGGGDDAHPLFIGSALSVTLVRPALGPNTKPGLEIVRIAEAAGNDGATLVRRRARFTPQGSDADSSHLPRLRDPVVLLHAPYRVSFSYAGDDRQWKDHWRDAKQLPRTIRILVRDTATERILPVSTAVTLHVDGPPSCQKSGKDGDCGKETSTHATPGKTPKEANSEAADNNTAVQQ